MKLTSLLFSLPLILLQAPLSLRDKHFLISRETKSYVSSLLSRWSSSGLSLAVVRHTNDPTNPWHIEYASFGIATADGQAIDENTVFAIASNSKLFLAVSVGLLIHNETLQAERKKAGLRKLEWNSRIADVLGDKWGLWDEYMSREVTIQDMLSHRTGMPRHDLSAEVREIPEVIKTLRFLRPSATHRETFQYNNLMYETLSYLPRHLLDVPYELYIAENIFKPLNMSSSTFSIAEVERWSADPERMEIFAHGFQWHARDVVEGGKGSLRATVPYYWRPGEEGILAGAGGILTTTKDLTIWTATLLNRGRHPYTNTSIIPSTVLDHVERGMTVTEHEPSDPELSIKLYGSGLFRYSYQGHELLEHGGNIPGFKTQVVRFPKENLAVISLSNDANGIWLMDAAKWRVAEDILGLRKIDWNSRYEKRWNKFLRDNANITPRPKLVVPPSQPITLLGEKTFHHPTYGTLRPCVVSYNESISSFTYHHEECATTQTSPTVKMVLSRSNLSIPTIIIPWKRFLATHLRLTHFQGNIFNVTVVWGNAEVRKKEGIFTCGEDDEDDGAMLLLKDERFEMEWVHGPEEGFAFRGGFWGRDGLSVRELEEKEGKRSAEVWFEAV